MEPVSDCVSTGVDLDRLGVVYAIRVTKGWLGKKQLLPRIPPRGASAESASLVMALVAGAGSY